LTLLEENQYLVVFFLTCIIFLGRLMINYFSFKSRELLNSADDDFVTARDDQKFAQNADIANIMATLVKTKQQLVDSKAREKKLTSDKNDAIKKLLSLQHELDEARADIDMLNKVKII
jgi:septal ring factor EnvC (AmiA/AmiB activator)